MHTYIHTYIQTYIHAYIHIYIQTYIHTYIQTYIHTYKHTYIHTYTHTYIYTYIQTNIHTYIYIHTYIHQYTRHRTRTHAHTHGVMVFICKCLLGCCGVMSPLAPFQTLVTVTLINHNLLIPWSRFLPRKLKGRQLIKNFAPLCGTCSPPPFSILSWFNPVHAAPSRFMKDSIFM